MSNPDAWADFPDGTVCWLVQHEHGIGNEVGIGCAWPQPPRKGVVQTIMPSGERWLAENGVPVTQLHSTYGLYTTPEDALDHLKRICTMTLAELEEHQAILEEIIEEKEAERDQLLKWKPDHSA